VGTFRWPTDAPASGEVLRIASTGSPNLLEWAAVAGGGGAPTDATYITQTPNGTLTNEQPLSALATGILKSTTGTGVLSIAAAGTDYESPGAVATHAALTSTHGVTGDIVGTGGAQSITGAKTFSDITVNDNADGIAFGNVTTGTTKLRNQNDTGALVIDLPATTGTLALTSQLASYQPLDAALTSISGLTTVADRMIYTTAADTYAVTTLTATARSLLDDTSTTAMRSTLGLVIGTNVQAFDSGLLSIAGLTTVADRMIYTTASDAYAVTTLTSFARSLLDDASDTEARSTIGLVIGSNVQAYDADLTAIAALATTDGNIIVGNGTTWVAESGATVRTSLGLGTANSPQFTAVNVGSATDTTLARVSAGDVSVEGNLLYRAGGTDVPVTDGGTGASTIANARINLGLVIGSDIQAYHDNLEDISGAGDPGQETLLIYNTTGGVIEWLTRGRKGFGFTWLSQYTPVTASDPTSATTLIGAGVLGTKTLPASHLEQGSAFRVAAGGVFSDPAVGAMSGLTFAVALGGITLDTAVASFSASTFSNRWWHMTADVVVASISGSTANVRVQGVLHCQTGASSYAVFPFVTTATVGVTSITSTRDWNLTVLAGGISPGDGTSVVCSNLAIEQLY
jgi:hypothetical protein